MILDTVTLKECTNSLALALEQKDIHTQMHSIRVIGLVEELGIICNLTDKDLKSLKLAAAFHDIGKIGIPDNILLKPGSFNENEWEIMKTHSQRGEKIVNALDLKDEKVISYTVRHHHEYYNGKGYPDGLKEEEIHIFARIISICDSYDAMGSPRPYHQQKAHTQVIKILKEERGLKHDPIILDKFLRLIETSVYRVE